MHNVAVDQLKVLHTRHGKGTTPCGAIGVRTESRDVTWTASGPGAHYGRVNICTRYREAFEAAAAKVSMVGLLSYGGSQLGGSNPRLHCSH